MGFTDTLPLVIKVFKEGTSKQVPYVAYSPELDLSAAGKDAPSAKKALLAVIDDVLAHKFADGTLDAYLKELGFRKGAEVPELSFVQVSVCKSRR